MKRSSLCIVVLAMAVLMPALGQANKDVELRALAKDIAESIEAKATQLHANGVAGYAPGSDVRDRADRVQRTFIQLSQSELGERDLRQAGFDLGRLSMDAPELYIAVVNEAAMRTRIESMQRTSGLRVFVSPEVLRRGLDLFKVLLAEGKAIEPVVEPAFLPRGDDDERRISLDELDELGAEVDHTLGQSEIEGQANRFMAVRIGQALYELYDKLRSSGRRTSDALNDRILTYLLETDGPAFRFYRLHAFYGDNRSAVRLGNLYREAFCRDATTMRLSCFTVIARTAQIQGALEQIADRKATIEMLERALRDSEQLRKVIGTLEKASEEVDAQGKNAAWELRSFLRSADDIASGDPLPSGVDKVEGSLAIYLEGQAGAYWVGKAAGHRLARVAAAVDRATPRGLFGGNDGLVEVVLTGAFVLSSELEDHPSALNAIRALRERFHQLAREEGVNPRQGAPIVLELMEAQLLVDVNQLPAARRLLAAMKQRDTFREPRNDARTGPFRLLANCRSARDFEPRSELASEQEAELSQQHYLLAKLEIQIARRLGGPIPRTRLAWVMEHEARQMLRDPSSKGVPPSTLAAYWLEYRRLLAGDKALQRQAAKAIKCLLTRPDVVELLGVDFINKSGPDRQRLHGAVFAILGDSGAFEKSGATLLDDDFALLQAVSMLQAQNGISAFTARSVFSDPKARQVLQGWERESARMSDQFADLRAGLDLSRQLSAMRQGMGGLDDMLQVMQRYPGEFAKYAALRNQSIASLAAVKEALGSGEAALLLTVFDDKVVIVVVKRDATQMAVAALPRKALQQSVAQLRGSLDLLGDAVEALPPSYRADIGWRLHQQLIKPVAPALSGVDTIYLVAGEDLTPIPFAALVSAAPPPQSAIDFQTYRQLQWLGDRFAFVSLPSVHALLRSKAAGDKGGDGKLLGVGEAEVAPRILTDLGLAPMPDTGSLLSRAGKSIDPTPLLHADASFSRLLAASGDESLGQADILLINSHALRAGASERYGTKEPAILLAPSLERKGADFVDPPQVMSLKVSLRLIMLLACETAGGRSKENAQPFAGLINSFFFAGANSVVATHLPVHPAVSEEFAVSFLRHVRDDGQSSAKALQRATADLRCMSQAEACLAGRRFVWAHPAYWSHFTLVGSGQ